MYYNVKGQERQNVFGQPSLLKHFVSPLLPQNGSGVKEGIPPHLIIADHMPPLPPTRCYFSKYFPCYFLD